MHLSEQARHDGELIARLIVAALLCGLVGAEREHRGHEAGLRTFGLVGLGSAGLVALSGDAFPASADKVVAGIITGIGFLGAGMLVRSGETVHNLTSAAASWAAAALGAVIGAGRYSLGLAMTVLALLLLEIPYIPLLRRMDPNARERDLRP
jgi:putative Mg2+ transporter-C (MgtC) family protein